MCCQPDIEFYMSSRILRLLRIRNIPIKRWYMNLNSSAHNSSVPTARPCNLSSKNMCSVAKESFILGRSGRGHANISM